MPKIKKLVLQNFKKFKSLELNFNQGINILVGDNETGKSSVLLALDLILSASRSRVEAIGIEALFCKSAIDEFFEGAKTVALLPVLYAEIYLEEGDDHDLNGKQNSKQFTTDGLRMEISPVDEYEKFIKEVLADGYKNFPFEYYGVKFSTFAGQPYLNYKRPLNHLLLDSSRIDSDHAAREYTRAVFGLNAEVVERRRLENLYRLGKDTFRDVQLKALNEKLGTYQFGVRSSTRSNLETDLVITEDSIPIENRGKGKQCFVKTEFALSKHTVNAELHALLLEEPENHLSHTNMKKLVEKLSATTTTQLFIATHSSHICSRLDLRRAQLLGVGAKATSLSALTPDTADFFMKAPDNNVLQFVLSKKVILVEGDAEFILLDALYRKVTGGISPEQDGVHIIAIGGISFKRYLELARLLEIKTAVIRDNDGDYAKNCVVSYDGHLFSGSQVFADKNNARKTFEITIYEDNKDICDTSFGAGRKTLSVQEYMLKNKAEAALQLLKDASEKLVAPDYLQEAISWIRG